jgi:hypothetical protein
LAHPKKPEFALLSEDGTANFNHPAVLREVDSGEYYGPAELILRKGGANLSETAVRLRINGNTLGTPQQGMVLSATDGSGTVVWDWPAGSTRIDASPDSAPWYLAHAFPGGTGTWRAVATFTSSTVGTWCMRTQVTFQWRVDSGAWNTVGTKTLVTARDNADDRASENWTRDVLIPSTPPGGNLQLQILASGSCAINSLSNSIKLIAVKQ